jgi:hypothetical protein
MGLGNTNLNTVINAGNTGRTAFANLGVPNGILLVPVGTTIAASSMVDQTTFASFVAAKLINDTRSSRWFAISNLDKFNNETEKTAREKTGRLNLAVYDFPPEFSFRYMLNMGNNIELLNFQNCQGQYDLYLTDTFGNVWGTADTTGAGRLLPYTNQQFYVQQWDPHTTGTDSAFSLMITIADPTQWNANFDMYQANYAIDSAKGLQNVQMNDVSATIGTALSITTTTTIVAIAKQGQGSTDFFLKYGGSLTAGCFTAKNLTLGTTLTISTATFGTVVSGGQTYNYGKFVLSGAPTATNVVQISLAAPSVTNAVIPNLNSVVEIINANADGQNACVHTF